MASLVSVPFRRASIKREKRNVLHAQPGDEAHGDRSPLCVSGHSEYYPGQTESASVSLVSHESSFNIEHVRRHDGDAVTE